MKLSNLPPGVTDRMIEEQAQPRVESLLEALVAAVQYDVPLGMQSPRIKLALNRAENYLYEEDGIYLKSISHPKGSWFRYLWNYFRQPKKESIETIEIETGDAK